MSEMLRTLAYSICNQCFELIEIRSIAGFFSNRNRYQIRIFWAFPGVRESNLGNLYGQNEKMRQARGSADPE